MNRTRRKAAKMFRRKYGKAKNPYWQARPQSGWNREGLDIALRAAFEKCVPNYGPIEPILRYQ